MRDPEMRAELHRRLQLRYGDDPNVRIVDEMSVLGGACRIDVALINGRLEGFEIKSESDSLSRLPRQAVAYSQVFDRLTMICAERHLEPALALLPDWWGVEVAEPREASTRLVRKRPARANPEVDPQAVAQLLWRSEALAALEARNEARGMRSKPRRALWSALAETTPRRELRLLVRETLRARQGWLVAD
ncbi:MAG TPA: sce7726 family protein [Solirubrobacterales bacterium]|nr:sce7726 family protein [Solirubrobacterales bacterium]